MELSSIERQSPDSVYRESEEMYNVAFCNCVSSSDIIVNLLAILCSYVNTRKQGRITM